MVRANRVATGTVTPATPKVPATPVDAEESMLQDLAAECPPAEDVAEDCLNPEDLPFSAGIPPGQSGSATVGKKALVIDELFVESNPSTAKARRMSSLKGDGV